MAITYTIATNLITVTGYTEATPCNFTDIYNSDKAGTLSLHARTGITAVDGAAVATNRAERPADYIVLGGASQDLYIIIANWVGTTATIQITGTDRDGTAQTEDIVVTANGNYFTTKWFKTITHTQVTVFTATGFDYDLTQRQWGVVSMLGTIQLKIDAYVLIGDGSTETHFSDSSKVVYLADSFQFKILSYITLNKCIIYGVVGKFFTGYQNANPELVKLTDCTFHYIRIQGYIDEITRCMFVNGAQIRFLRDTTLSRCTITGGAGFETRYDLLIDDLLLTDCTPSGFTIRLPVNYPAPDLTVKNLKIRNAVTSSISINNYGSIDSPSGYLINPDLDVWSITWANSAGAILYRQYEFDLKVIDKNNTPIQTATVKIYDKDSTLIVDTTTDVNGIIATQTISRGYYNQANGNTLQEYSPHLIKIEKAGYTTYEADFTLGAKTDWLVALQTGGGGLMRNPPMTGGMV